MQEPISDASPGEAQLHFGPVGWRLLALSKALAMAGGLVFVALVVMSIVSIVGRKLAAAPVPGDVEVLQMSAAFACACFFAYCHMVGGDVKVDFFTANMSARNVHRLDALGSFLFGLMGAVLAWRGTVGALAMRASEETSVILGVPVWIAQILMQPGLILMALAGFYMAFAHLRASAAAPRAKHKPEALA